MPAERVPDGRKDGSNLVFGAVVEAVSRQRLAPGTKLPEENLAQIFNVSRAHVRAALSRLKMRGLVQMEPNRTAQIAEPSVQEVRQLFSVRRWMEPELAADVAENLDKAGEALIKAHVDKEQAARDVGDRT
jgi:DNA-binding GntR family transcriptional regulator